MLLLWVDMIFWYCVQMIWQLVRSSWILHTSCNKRRVAPIAALLSAVLHASVFREIEMHVASNGPGPLKWVCIFYVHFGLWIFPSFHVFAWCICIIVVVLRKGSWRRNEKSSYYSPCRPSLDRVVALKSYYPQVLHERAKGFDTLWFWWVACYCSLLFIVHFY